MASLFQKAIIAVSFLILVQAAEAGMYYSYEKKTDQYTTYELVQPDYEQMPEQARITELCTIDGTTYVSVPENLELPVQPKQITLKSIIMTPQLKAKIRQVSPHVKLMESRMAKNENVRLTKQDELNMECLKDFLPSPVACAVYIGKCREWNAIIMIGETPKL